MATCRSRLCRLAVSSVFLAAGFVAGGRALAESVKIVSFTIGPGIQSEDGTGFYAMALKRVLEETGQDYTFSVLPLQRAFRAFSGEAADCIWAIDVKTIGKMGYATEMLIESHSLFASELHIFVPPGVAAPADFKELEGKSVGLSLGSPVPEVLEGLSIRFTFVRSLDVKVRMLARHRLDAIAAWMPDILVAFRNNGMVPTSHNPNLPIVKSGVGLVCWQSPATRAFLHAVNPRIETFKESGTLRAIFQELELELQSE